MKKVIFKVKDLRNSWHYVPKEILNFLESKKNRSLNDIDFITITCDETEYDKVFLKINYEKEQIVYSEGEPKSVYEFLFVDNGKFQNYYDLFMFECIISHDKTIQDIDRFDISISEQEALGIREGEAIATFTYSRGQDLFEVLEKMKVFDSGYHQYGYIVFKDGSWLEDEWDSDMYCHEMRFFEPARIETEFSILGSQKKQKFGSINELMEFINKEKCSVTINEHFEIKLNKKEGGRFK